MFGWAHDWEVSQTMRGQMVESTNMTCVANSLLSNCGCVRPRRRSTALCLGTRRRIGGRAPHAAYDQPAACAPPPAPAGEEEPRAYSSIFSFQMRKKSHFFHRNISIICINSITTTVEIVSVPAGQRSPARSREIFLWRLIPARAGTPRLELVLPRVPVIPVTVLRPGY